MDRFFRGSKRFRILPSWITPAWRARLGLRDKHTLEATIVSHGDQMIPNDLQFIATAKRFKGKDTRTDDANVKEEIQTSFRRGKE